MSHAWSVYVIVLVALNIAGCVALLWWTSRSHPGDAPDNETGHVWDGNITEYNKPLPRWWINLFYITIAFSVGYLAWYGGLGDFKGYSGWSSQREHAVAKAAGDAQLAVTFRAYNGVSLPQLARDPHALTLGRSIFANNCATCHGSTAHGAVGYPNLTDSSWQWGGEPETMLATVLNGRTAAMPGWGRTLIAMGGAGGIDDVAIYVLSLSGKAGADADPKQLVRGKTFYDGICIACHGPAGKGNPVLGAPDLTDDYWLYGSSRDALYTSIAEGRSGAMPAHLPLLGETRVRLAAAYVWSLTNAGAAP